MQRSQPASLSNNRASSEFTSIYGNAENNIINGDIDNNLIYGSGGNDLISGGDGYDILTYQNALSAVTLLRGGTILQGNQNTDQITDFSIEKIIGPRGFNNSIDGSTGSTASVNINSRTGQLTINGLPGVGNASIEFENFSSITGSQNDDIIIGSRNREQLSGAAGNDYIKGGIGRDQLTGGLGNDIFSFTIGDSTLSNWDIITDFSMSEDFIEWDQEITQMNNAGFVNSLRRRDIAELLDESKLSAGAAALIQTIMPNNEIDRSFLMINDSKEGFQGKDETMIEITGFTGFAEEMNFI